LNLSFAGKGPVRPQNTRNTSQLRGTTPGSIQSVVPSAGLDAQETVQFVSPLDDPDWNLHHAQLPGFSVFHTLEWCRVLVESYQHEPLWLQAGPPDRPIGLLPLCEVRSRLTGRRGACLPFADFCRPLFALGICAEPGRSTPDPDAPDSVAEALLRAAIELGRQRGWRHLELRGPCPGLVDAVSPRSSPPIPSTTLLEHRVGLDGAEAELFNRCDPAVRRAVRKAQMNGVQVEFRSDLESVQEFYELHERTRRRHGLPPQPFQFFEKIHQHLLARGMGFVALARRKVGGQRSEVRGQRAEDGGQTTEAEGRRTEDRGRTTEDGRQRTACPPKLAERRRKGGEGRAIAGAVFLQQGPEAVYKFGASDPAWHELRANNLVLWQSFVRCQAHGVSSVSLGRTNPDHDGLRRFKLGWGARELQAPYYRLDLWSNRWVTARDATVGWHNHFFRQLPLWANRWAGRLLYPHLD
jgi:hypothetical protein